MQFKFYLLLLLGFLTHTPSMWANGTIRLDIRGRHIEGHPLSWTSNNMHLLGRDGALWSFNPTHARNMRKISSRFNSYSSAEMRAGLYREFGKRFDVSGTGHYLIVHPKGKRDRWANCFEDFYRSFVHYFRSRGIQTQSPPFPLVVVVFHQRQDFERLAIADGVRITQRLLGYYSSTSNRIFVYDTGAGKNNARQWQINSETILHEAAHQSAFNTGIHSRFGSTPRWLAEGLGTLFEAKGVWDSRTYQQREDRVNRGRLKAFRRHLPNQSADVLAKIVADDDLFQRNSDHAYAEAWALTFFLTETEPQKYKQFLQKTATREPFTNYRSVERQKDFAGIFGKDLRMLNARLERFIKTLP